MRCSCSWRLCVWPTLGLGLVGLEALVQFVCGLTVVLRLDAATLGQRLTSLLLANEGSQLGQHNILLQHTVLEGANLFEEAVGKALDVLGGITEVLGLHLGDLGLGQTDLLGAQLTVLLGQRLLLLAQFNGLWS